MRLSLILPAKFLILSILGHGTLAFILDHGEVYTFKNAADGKLLTAVEVGSNRDNLKSATTTSVTGDIPHRAQQWELSEVEGAQDDDSLYKTYTVRPLTLKISYDLVTYEKFKSESAENGHLLEKVMYRPLPVNQSDANTWWTVGEFRWREKFPASCLTQIKSEVSRLPCAKNFRNQMWKITHVDA